MVQFVRSSRLYSVALKDAIEYSYMDIIKATKKDEKPRLQLLQTINKYMIDSKVSKIAE
jgi:hypothetical protein